MRRPWMIFFIFLSALCTIAGVVWFLRVRASRDLERGLENVTISNASGTSIVVSTPDSDGDGLGDAREKTLGTDPAKLDTDGDFLSDFEEVEIFKTDPLGTNTPFGLTTSSGSFSPVPAEPVSALAPSVVEPAPSSDEDGDGLTLEEEKEKYHTDPSKADSDGDGYQDAEEIRNGYNPLGAGRCLTTRCLF